MAVSVAVLARNISGGARARAYNGGLGAEPLAGSRGRAPGQGVKGQSPPEAEALLAFGRSMEAANLAIFLKFGNANKLDIYLCYLCKKSWVATKLGAWSKTGGDCAPPRLGPKTATANYTSSLNCYVNIYFITYWNIANKIIWVLFINKLCKKFKNTGKSLANALHAQTHRTARKRHLPCGII